MIYRVDFVTRTYGSVYVEAEDEMHARWIAEDIDGGCVDWDDRDGDYDIWNVEKLDKLPDNADVWKEREE